MVLPHHEARHPCAAGGDCLGLQLRSMNVTVRCAPSPVVLPADAAYAHGLAF
jgi:hypothetical protein